MTAPQRVSDERMRLANFMATSSAFVIEGNPYLVVGSNEFDIHSLRRDLISVLAEDRDTRAREAAMRKVVDASLSVRRIVGRGSAGQFMIAPGRFLDEFVAAVDEFERREGKA